MFRQNPKIVSLHSNQTTFWSHFNSSQFGMCRIADSFQISKFPYSIRMDRHLTPRENVHSDRALLEFHQQRNLIVTEKVSYLWRRRRRKKKEIFQAVSVLTVLPHRNVIVMSRVVRIWARHTKIRYPWGAHMLLLVCQCQNGIRFDLFPCVFFLLSFLLFFHLHVPSFFSISFVTWNVKRNEHFTLFYEYKALDKQRILFVHNYVA